MAQVAFVLQQADEGIAAAEVCRKGRHSHATSNNWHKRSGGMIPSEVKKLRQLEGEKTKLKRLVADLSWDIAIRPVDARRLRVWRQARPFFARSSRSAAASSICSASSFFSFAFSYSKGFKRLASVRPITPNFAFQSYSVAMKIPYSRTRSAHFAPAFPLLQCAIDLLLGKPHSLHAVCARWGRTLSQRRGEKSRCPVMLTKSRNLRTKLRQGRLSEPGQ